MPLLADLRHRLGAIAECVCQQLLRSGQTALGADDYPPAPPDFERARQIAPDNLEANRGLVLSYLQLGRLTRSHPIGQRSRRPLAARRRNSSIGSDSPISKQGRTSRHWKPSSVLKPSRAASFDIHFDLALVLAAAESIRPRGR